MRFDEYRALDGLSIAESIAHGDVSSAEVLELAFKRAGEINPRLNAIVTWLIDEARARAEGPLQGPFAGVPFLVKDLFQDIAGVLSTNGSRALHRFRPKQNSEVVNRWLHSGAVIFGKTNTPEFGVKSITEPDRFGATRNPWNLGRSPGGSSGGSAAAIAAGIVPIAGGNDAGGSLRVPAAACGLFALKAGRGRVPAGPQFSELFNGMGIHGVMSRSVRDSAAMLDVMAGPDPMAPFHMPAPEQVYVDEVKRDPGRLRIGYSLSSPMGTDVHPQAVAAVEDAARLLSSLGHDVEHVEPDFGGMEMARDFLTAWFSIAAAQMDEIRRCTAAREDEFEFDTRIMAAMGRNERAVDYVTARNRWHRYTVTLAAYHQQFDLMLTPTLGCPPVALGSLHTPRIVEFAGELLLTMNAAGFLRRFTDIIDDIARKNLAWAPFTMIANMTGRPAMSVPLYWTPENLPLGVQFIGPPGSEGLLFRLAGQLETTRPWFNRLPPM